MRIVRSTVFLAVAGLFLSLWLTGCALDQQLVSIDVTPSSQTVNAIGATTQFIATGHYTHPVQTKDITNSVTWASSVVNVATVNTTGLATAVNCGTTTITATAPIKPGEASAVVGTATLTVSAPVCP